MLLFLLLLLGLQATTGTLEVTVHLAGTTTPLSGVEVSLNGINKQKTDESGRVVYTNLENGSYRVNAERSGYFRKDDSLPYSDIRPSSLLRLLTPQLGGVTALISSSNLIQRVSIGMFALGSIEGRVTDKNGVPLNDVNVSTGIIHYENGRRTLDEWGRVRTGLNGVYQLTSLAPGEYYVRAELPNVEHGYAPTHYPGETDIQRATWITVRSGDQIGGIDFAVSANPATFSISGKVVDIPKRILPDGQVANRNIQFAIIRHDPDIPDFAAPFRLINGLVNDKGEFLITGIPPGSWDLLPVTDRQEVPLAPTRSLGRVQVEVVDADVHDVVIVVTPISVTGRTRMRDGSTVPIPLRGMLVPRDNTPFVNHLTQAKLLGFLDGRFEFENVPPGKYSFQFEEVPAGFYLADIRQGARSINDDGIIEVGTQPPLPIEIVLGKGGGKLTGKVEGLPEKANVQEYGSTRVVLIPAQRRNLTLYQVTSLSPDGRFSFSYLAPGDYKIFALKNLQNGAEKSSEFLTRYEALGTSVTIANNSSEKEVLVPIIRND